MNDFYSTSIDKFYCSRLMTDAWHTYLIISFFLSMIYEAEASLGFTCFDAYKGV